MYRAVQSANSCVGRRDDRLAEPSRRGPKPPKAPTARLRRPPRRCAEPPTPEDDAIIVTGTRRALKTSQNIKRNADTVVDSITATDIGAFPDKSIAESLQRVPGVTVNRFSASDDTSHISGDPSGVLVRGLQPGPLRI